METLTACDKCGCNNLHFKEEKLKCNIVHKYNQEGYYSQYISFQCFKCKNKVILLEPIIKDKCKFCEEIERLKQHNENKQKIEDMVNEKLDKLYISMEDINNENIFQLKLNETQYRNGNQEYTNLIDNKQYIYSKRYDNYYLHSVYKDIMSLYN